MPSFNKVILMGHLGKSPELRYTPEGKAVTSFTLATNDKRKDEQTTQWWKVTLWGHQAESAAKYLDKGRAVYIEGRLRIEEWTDRDGKNRYTLDVQATDLQFLGSGEKTEGPDLKAHLMAQNTKGASDDSIIPF